MKCQIGKNCTAEGTPLVHHYIGKDYECGWGGNIENFAVIQSVCKMCKSFYKKCSIPDCYCNYVNIYTDDSSLLSMEHAKIRKHMHNNVFAIMKTKAVIKTIGASGSENSNL